MRTFFDYNHLLDHLKMSLSVGVRPTLQTWVMKEVSKPGQCIRLDIQRFKDVQITKQDGKNRYTFRPMKGLYFLPYNPLDGSQMDMSPMMERDAIGAPYRDCDKATWMFRSFPHGMQWFGSDPPSKLLMAGLGQGTWIDTPACDIEFTAKDIREVQEVQLLQEAYDKATAPKNKMTPEQALTSASILQRVALVGGPVSTGTFNQAVPMINTTTLGGSGAKTMVPGMPTAVNGGYTVGTGTSPSITSFTGGPGTTITVLDEDAVDDGPVMMTAVRKQVMLRMPEDVRDRIKALADRDGASVNELINTLIRRELDERDGTVAPSDEQLLVSYFLHSEDPERIEAVRAGIRNVIAAYGGTAIAVCSRYEKALLSITRPKKPANAFNPMKVSVMWVQLHTADPGVHCLDHPIGDRKPVFNEGGAAKGRLDFDGHFLKWVSFPATCMITNWSLWDDQDDGTVYASGPFGMNSTLVSIGDTFDMDHLSVDMSNLAP